MRAALYARYSSDASNPTSSEDQLYECREKAETLGCTTIVEYNDDASHGESTAHRSSFLQLISDIGKGQFDIVITEAVDRLGRNVADIATFWNVCRYHSVAVQTVHGAEENENSIIMNALQAQQHNRRLGDKVIRGQRSANRKGRPVNGLAYGYKVIWTGEPPEPERVVHDQEAAILRRAFKERDAGMSTVEIVARLNAEGIPGPGLKRRLRPDGAPNLNRQTLWHPSALTGSGGKSGIFKNRLYIGDVIWGVKTSRYDPLTGKRVTTLGPPDRVRIRKNERFRIIDDALFQRVQKTFGNKPRAKSHEYRKPAYLFSGLVRCGICGSSYVVSDRTLMSCHGHIVTSTCNNSRRIDRHEMAESILDHLRSTMLSPERISDFIKNFKDAYGRSQADSGQLLTQNSAKLSDLAGRIDALLLTAESTNATHETRELLAARVSGLVAERTKVEAAGRALRKVKLPAFLDDDIAEILKRQLAELTTALAVPGPTQAFARDKIRSLITEIVVDPTPAPAGKEWGFRGARLIVRGQIIDLLGLGVDASELIIMTGQDFQDGRYYDPTYEFEFTLGDGKPYVGPREPKSLPAVRNMLQTAAKPLSRGELAGEVMQCNGIEHYAAYQQVKCALRRLITLGLVERLPTLGKSNETALYVWRAEAA